MSTHLSHEVEIKFLVHDAPALELVLRSAGFRQQTPSTFESNTLYDDAHGSLRSYGEVLRLRQYGAQCLLTHKSRGTAERHKSRVEHETVVANAGQMHAILTALGFRPSFRYEKYRAQWTDGIGEVVIDRTPIGDLGEIEGPPDWIDRTAHALGLTDRDYITDSYAALFFQWKARTASPALNMTFDECGTPRP
jgi:adenylate cyclase class 2